MSETETNTAALDQARFERELDGAIDLIGAMLGEVGEQVTGALMPPGRRVQVALAYNHIVLSHGQGVLRLLEASLFPSAFALARPMYESLVKGMWMARAPSEEQLERHVRGSELEGPYELLTALRSSDLPHSIAAELEAIKKRDWKGLSSLVHGGHAEMSRWLSPDGVELVRTAQEVRELGNFTGYMLACAGFEMGRLAGRNDVSLHFQNLLPRPKMSVR